MPRHEGNAPVNPWHFMCLRRGQHHAAAYPRNARPSSSSVSALGRMFGIVFVCKLIGVVDDEIFFFLRQRWLQVGRKQPLTRARIRLKFFTERVHGSPPSLIRRWLNTIRTVNKETYEKGVSVAPSHEEVKSCGIGSDSLSPDTGPGLLFE
jgi:hypothetical protein